jgi:hypothetical protein
MADLANVPQADLMAELVSRVITRDCRSVDGGLCVLLEKMGEYLSPDQSFELANKMRDAADKIEHVCERAKV